MSALTSKLLAIVVLTGLVAACATPVAPPAAAPGPAEAPIVRKG